MKNATLLLASLGCFALTLLAFVSEVNASTCQTKCDDMSNQCYGTRQVCAACSSGGFGGCGVNYSYYNSPIPAVTGGESMTSTFQVYCYSFANCTAGAPAAWTGCAAACGGWSIYSCAPCATGTFTNVPTDECQDDGCNES